MGHYQLALATREPMQSRYSDMVGASHGIIDSLSRLGRHGWRSHYYARHGRDLERTHTEVSGVVSGLESFIVDIAHVMLLIGGLWMFVNAILQHG